VREVSRSGQKLRLAAKLSARDNVPENPIAYRVSLCIGDTIYCLDHVRRGTIHGGRSISVNATAQASGKQLKQLNRTGKVIIFVILDDPVTNVRALACRVHISQLGPLRRVSCSHVSL
jgi:hypothetical protein